MRRALILTAEINHDGGGSLISKKAAIEGEEIEVKKPSESITSALIRKVTREFFQKNFENCWMIFLMLLLLYIIRATG